MSIALPLPQTSERSLSPTEIKRLQTQADTDQLVAVFHRDQLKWGNVDWVVTLFLITVHVGALFAFVPTLFSWSGLAICLALHWATCSIGICLGYHRYLSHKSMKLRAPAEFVALACGCISGEGSPLTWAATHRLHHHKSDHEGDPHSPVKDSSFWSHFLWLFPKRTTESTRILFRRYIPELVSQPMLQFFEKTFALWLWGSGLALLGAGWAIGGWTLGVSWLVWGMCVRMVAAYHSTWFVNSATHLWGYRNYDTRDESRNLWWVAVLAYGEGWHNNHHAHPAVAPAGHKWWEFDVTWWSIKALRAVGLAYDVKDRVPEGRGAADVPPDSPVELAA
jgi:fatty-acid desaturase